MRIVLLRKKSCTKVSVELLNYSNSSNEFLGKKSCTKVDQSFTNTNKTNVQPQLAKFLTPCACRQQAT